MITVSYGMHRKKEEILVGEMMRQLPKVPYKNLNFLDLSYRNWRYLKSHSEGFVFDVHGGSQSLKLFTSELVLPSPSFLLFSNVVEDEFVDFLKKYNTGQIYLAHKKKIGPLPGSNDYWQSMSPSTAEFYDGASATVRKYGLTDRLVAIELFNATDEWQMKQHRAFMKVFLRDLDNQKIPKLVE